jgi:hypothetical protein
MKTWSHLGKILYLTNQVSCRSGWSMTSNALSARRMTPIVLSTKLGIARWINPDYPSGVVITTDAHGNFECPNPGDNVAIKFWLAYEQNTYSTHWVRSGSYHREISLSYDICLLSLGYMPTWISVMIGMPIRLLHVVTTPRYSELVGCASLPQIVQPWVTVPSSTWLDSTATSMT